MLSYFLFLIYFRTHNKFYFFFGNSWFQFFNLFFLDYWCFFNYVFLSNLVKLFLFSFSDECGSLRRKQGTFPLWTCAIYCLFQAFPSMNLSNRTCRWRDCCRIFVWRICARNGCSRQRTSIVISISALGKWSCWYFFCFCYTFVKCGVFVAGLSFNDFVAKMNGR